MSPTPNLKFSQRTAPADPINKGRARHHGVNRGAAHSLIHTLHVWTRYRDAPSRRCIRRL